MKILLLMLLIILTSNAFAGIRWNVKYDSKGTRGCCQNLCVNSVSGPGKALFQVIG